MTGGRPPTSTDRAAGFDRVASIYRTLEYLAFGRSLERARFMYLDRLAGCRSVLVIGDGDGRCVERLAALAPAARIVCIDTSGAMLARLASRLDAATRARVELVQADVRTVDLGVESFDAVLTMFVLDCLSATDVEVVVRRLLAHLRPHGQWLFVDFTIPPRGWRRLRARLWVGLLYRFFAWQTGLDVRELPPSESILRRAGLMPAAEATFEHGMIRSVVLDAPIS